MDPWSQSQLRAWPSREAVLFLTGWDAKGQKNPGQAKGHARRAPARPASSNRVKALEQASATNQEPADGERRGREYEV